MDTVTQGMKRDEKLASLIGDVSFAMLTTRAADGTLRSRPMACPKDHYDGDLWFFTADEAGKAREIEHEAQVNVSFAEPKHQRYVSVSGSASVVRDPAKAKALWSPVLKGWFPGGPDDPHLALLRVVVEHAEYWDARANRMLVLASLAKAAVTGKPPQTLGEHRTLA